jgi:hypothetical protein
MPIHSVQYNEPEKKSATITDDSGRTVSVSCSPANRVWRAVLEWEAASDENTIAPADVPAPTIADVRDHASALMQAAFGARDATHLDFIISNAGREATRLQAIRLGLPDPATPGAWLREPREWTPAEAQRAAELEAADAAIELIRRCSNKLEAKNPIPKSFKLAKYWSESDGSA